MNYLKGILQICAFIILSFMSFSANADTILMFVSHEQTYYSEYIVMKKALEAAGYTVEVRSASDLNFSTYMSPYSDISAVANDLSGSSYSEFQNQFLNLFGMEWDESLNSIPTSVSTDGILTNVMNIDQYVGIVVVGGIGSLAYRVDGTYYAQGEEEREVSASMVEQTAEYLNDLAIEALLQGKPVMAQCHGASIPAFWRIPDTSGPGEEALGYSLLKDQNSAGYPESATLGTLQALDVIYRPNDRVTISNAHSALTTSYSATAKIITTRDWYPQTVAHAARTFLNVLETFPLDRTKTSEINALVIHGGALDPENCGPENKDNDVPCNHGGGESLPADYTDLMNVLNANENNDDFNLVNDHLDLSTTELDLSNEAEVLTYFADYDVIVFFKHWSTVITDEMQQAIVTFADNGGGVVGLHHALYNDQEGSQNKDVLVTQLFGAESSPSGWAANLTTFNMYATNHGHFISSYLIEYDNVADHPTVASWESDPLSATANTSFSTLPFISMYDELYVNFNYTGDIALGREINEITPLFSNDALPPNASLTQTRQTGFTRLVDLDGDGKIGKVAYMAPGERTINVDAASTYGQMIRNAVVWSAPEAEKWEQTIEVASISDKLITDDPFEISASVSSELTLAYEVIYGPATNEGNLVTLTGVAGEVEIEISQEGNGDYLAATETISFVVYDPSKLDQEITFLAVEDQIFGNEPINLSATSTSELEVSFEYVSGPGTLDGSVLTITGAGAIVVEASQSGNDDYNPADTEEQTIIVSKANQEITFTEIEDQTYGASSIELSATSTSELEVSFEYVNGPGTLDGSVLTITGAGTIVVQASQSGDDNYNPADTEEQTITVSKANQTIEFSPLEDVPMTADPITLEAKTSTGLEVIFSVDGPANLSGIELILDRIPGTVTVTASQGGNENFHGVSVQQSFESMYVLSADPMTQCWNIYPNPVQNQLQIRREYGQSAHIEIYQVNGALSLAEKINGEGTVDVHSLPNGIYFLRIIEEKTVTTTKILISR
ncbi:Por secretion system C-terminal sorting domain-containing protein [Reichenbachiella faecimaris]|uniref:Por secretion system C-terminal sorting domain-containing protein n=1 Tax=Reichenbachiella faecimaris TaxID=692418 RepID=A0A1W2GJ62_REIFA|nr:T9SS type A sorting domain-containing protein [Reichenbachiella faecimaris]SMD36378.1 Por secretion system C-terminal sorting domain-containing protein [Reichenbachiella faecimaris]